MPGPWGQHPRHYKGWERSLLMDKCSEKSFIIGQWSPDHLLRGKRPHWNYHLSIVAWGGNGDNEACRGPPMSGHWHQAFSNLFRMNALTWVEDRLELRTHTGGARMHGFEFILCCLLAMWPWARCLILECFSFVFCKIGVLTLPISMR